MEIRVGDVDGEVAGVALVVHVPAGVALAVLRVVGHGADELEGVGDAVGLEVVPESGAPAGNFCDAVAEGHWAVVLGWFALYYHIGGGLLILILVWAAAKPARAAAARKEQILEECILEIPKDIIRRRWKPRK